MSRSALRVFLFAGLAATLVHAQTPSTPMPAGTNVLLGRVVEIGTDTPVGGAMVTLVGHFDAEGKPVTPNPAAPPSTLPPSLSVMTTRDGDFVFRDLPAGLFTVVTRAYGYVNNDYPPAVLDVRNGQKPTEVRLRMWRFATLAGRVVDERGEPIAGIPVSALRPLVAGGAVLLRRTDTVLTDDRGEYRLAQLQPGDYVVGVLSTATTLPEGVAAALDPAPGNREVFQAATTLLIQSGYYRTYGCPTCIGRSHEGQHLRGFVLQRPGIALPPAPDGRPLSFANTFHANTVRPQDATVVALGSGELRTGLDLTVRLLPAATVAGVLVGPDGPMPNVALTLVAPGMNAYQLEPDGFASAITDSRGAFVFLSATPGDYTLSGLALQDADFTSGTGRPLWVKHPLQVDAAGVADLTVTMQPGLPTSGRVEFRTASGTARPPSQRQVMSLEPIGAQAWRTISAVVQADGSFQTAGDPLGRYVVNVSSLPGWFWQTTSLAGEPLADQVIELGPAGVSDLVFTFGQTTNRVSGQVTGRDGDPDPDAAVIAFPADSTLWREGIFTSRRERKVHTTSSGGFDMATLAPGDYYVAAVDTGVALDWQHPRFLERLIPGASRVRLGADDQKSVQLRTIDLPRR